MTDPVPPAGIAVEEVASAGRRKLALKGELDIASVRVFDAALERARAEDTVALTLDLSELTFIDSTGIAAIVLAGKLCEREGYEFGLVPGPATVQRLFELTGLVDVLPFTEAPEAASEGVEDPPGSGA